MRLDMFLKVSRLMPRRNVAQEFCDAGRVSVNGGLAKSSKEIKAGDVVEIRRRQMLLKVVVKEVPANKQVPKHTAGELYEVAERREVTDDEN